MNKKLLEIIEHYGVSPQLKQLNEECYELIEAINDYQYNSFSEYSNQEYLKKHIEEEFADIMVMLEQFKIFYMLDNKKIMEIMEKKIDRQLERIENE